MCYFAAESPEVPEEIHTSGLSFSYCHALIILNDTQLAHAVVHLDDFGAVEHVIIKYCMNGFCHKLMGD